MNTELNIAKDYTKNISDYANGAKVFLVYNPTFSFGTDLWNAYSGILGSHRLPSDYLSSLCKDYLTQIPFQPGEILLIAHSDGGTVSYDSVNSETLRRLAPKQIHFRGIAPASRPTKTMCATSSSYAHWLDPVPRMRCAISSCKYIGEAMQDEYGPMPKFNPFEAGKIKYLTGHPDAPLLFDHSFDSPTFEPDLRKEIRKFIQH